MYTSLYNPQHCFIAKWSQQCRLKGVIFNLYEIWRQNINLSLHEQWHADQKDCIRLMYTSLLNPELYFIAKWSQQCRLKVVIINLHELWTQNINLSLHEPWNIDQKDDFYPTQIFLAEHYFITKLFVLMYIWSKTLLLSPFYVPKIQLKTSTTIFFLLHQ